MDQSYEQVLQYIQISHFKTPRNLQLYRPICNLLTSKYALTSKNFQNYYRVYNIDMLSYAANLFLNQAKIMLFCFHHMFKMVSSMSYTLKLKINSTGQKGRKKHDPEAEGRRRMSGADSPGERCGSAYSIPLICGIGARIFTILYKYYSITTDLHGHFGNS